MMQTDVKSVDLPANTGDVFSTETTRIKAVTLTYNGDGIGYFVIYWNDDYYYVETPNSIGMTHILIPGEGIKTGPTGAGFETLNVSATVYYG